MMATLQQQLIATVLKSLFYLSAVCRKICDICFGMAWDPIKVTKLAIGNTNVGGVDISIDLPGYLSMWYLLFSKFVGNKHQLSQRRLQKKTYTFFNRQWIKIECFLIKIF